MESNEGATFGGAAQSLAQSNARFGAKTVSGRDLRGADNRRVRGRLVGRVRTPSTRNTPHAACRFPPVKSLSTR